MKKQIQILCVAFLLANSVSAQVLNQSLLTDTAYHSGTGIHWWGINFSDTLNSTVLQTINGDTTVWPNNTQIMTEICGNSGVLYFDFIPNLPSGAIVQGFEVDIVKYGFNRYYNPANDTIARLTLNGSSISNNKAISSDVWPLFNATPAIYTYGGSTDLWGFSSLPTTLTKVSFELQAQDTWCQNIAIDYIELKVYYTDITSVHDQSEQSKTIKLYPNPAQNEFVVELARVEPNTQVRIFDALGQVVSSQLIMSNKQPISTSHLPAGTYFVKIQSPTQKYGVQRLVIGK